MRRPSTPGGGPAGYPLPDTVLLAADDDEVRKRMRFWLWNDGLWEVKEAADGREALDLLDDTVDILVLDRTVSDLLDSDVVERLEETGFEGDVIVLGTRRSDTDLDGDSAGHHLTKPVDREAFLTRVNRSVY